jgi:Fe-S-cluster containining protein
MELSSDDVKRLEEAGYRRDEFAVRDDHIVRLRNVGGWCYFYSLAGQNCRVYENRPLGCSLYPVVYSADKGAIVDELCPMGHTVSERELRAKGRTLINLLRKMDKERARATPSY